jgi:photosystem II stability/assembly factor-like uncharacterized protein
MTLTSRQALGLLLAAGLPAATALAAAKPKPAPQPKSDISALTFKGLEFRNIGPAIMGGRIDDFAVSPSDPATFYVGTASGGVFKTTNDGTTFEPVFDSEAVSTIGDLAIAPSDPQILYVGTGEPNNRQSSSWGAGVYRTLDGGKTWSFLGLKDTQHIGRIVVHPKNPDVVYVAALGHLWGPNKERGLFKTTDGGKTWTNVKFIDENTGFVDVAMDPQSPNTLYAASYERRRTAFGYDGGGPGGAIWKTVDGGATWTKLTSGLPTDGDVGRIGLAVYPRDPRVVYALVEHEKQGGIYRSDDRGETWTKMSSTNPRPSYYSQVRIDPNNDQRIWVLGAPIFYSEDGGRTFDSRLVQKIHGDYHALWIDPADSDHMLVGTDGGIHESHDRGRTWDFVNTIPLAQFYEITASMESPYTVCGGLQDNGSWCGPSRTLFVQGIGNEDWFRVGGGDGFYTVVDPSDANTVYVESQDGNVSRLNLATKERRVLRPLPPEGEKYRFNWDSPILLSPHDPKTVYYGGNRLFGSKDRGETWTLVTPDLTTNPKRDEMPILGKTSKDFMSRNDGIVHFGTITTIAESPLEAGVLWVGTDDGNLQVSRDGGATWTNVATRVPGVPKGTYVSRVEASRIADGAAYVAFDGHRSDDFHVYLYRTEDFGQTWTSVSGNIPAGETVHVVREHPQNPNLLFVGTEAALWASFDRGHEWLKLGNGLPTVPVDDVLIHPRDNDLIVGTHGRGIWVLDDAAALSRMSEAVAGEDLHLFEPRAATEWRLYNNKGNTGHKLFLAENPPEGVLVTYYLKARGGDKEKAKVTISDAAGKVVRELTGPAEAGVNRVAWDLRHEPPIHPRPGEPAGFFGPPRGPFVTPGTYTVDVALGSFKARKTVLVDEDPRLHVSTADRQAWEDAAQQTARLWGRADSANRTVESLQKQLGELKADLKKRPKTPPAVGDAVKAFEGKLSAVAKTLSRQEPLGFAGAPLADEPDPLLNQARGAYFAVSAITAPPTPQQQTELARLTREISSAVDTVNALVETDVPALNKTMLDAGIGRLDPGQAIH